MKSATVNFIGRIRTPYKSLQDCPLQAGIDTDPCFVELDEAMVPALKGIEEEKHLQLLYWFDKSDRSILQTIPRMTDTNETVGVFALRSPMRPNPIALSNVELLKVEGNILTISALDCVDGTPLLDIKCYVNQLSD